MWPGGDSPPAALDRVRGPRGELVLQRRGDHLEMVFNGVLLMASYNGASEAEMARIAYRRWQAGLGGKGAPRGPGPPGLAVLVGGLGMGYTLAAALDLPGVERVDVVELEPAVAAWNRGPLGHLNGGRLDDPRVRLVLADLAAPAALPQDACGYELILVDIDNGPERTVLASNRELYRPRGLARLARRLAPGGVVTFWCPGPSPALAYRLWRTLGRVERVAVPDPALPPGMAWTHRRPLPPSQVYVGWDAGTPGAGR